MEDLFYRIFESLPRQGPGDEKSTIKAFKELKDLPKNPAVLDIGCGSGSQTMTLLKSFPAITVTAIDLHGPFIEILKNKIEKEGYGSRVKCMVADMSLLDFAPGSFDIIWSEGAAYSIGFLNAVKLWHKFLKTKGFMVLSELSWKKEPKAIAPEIKEFFLSEYPGIKYYKDVCTQFSYTKMSLQKYFFIPDDSWWKDYYGPMQQKVLEFRKLCPEDKAVGRLLDSLELEMDMHKKYSGYYGYVFYILRNMA